MALKATLIEKWYIHIIDLLISWNYTFSPSYPVLANYLHHFKFPTTPSLLNVWCTYLQIEMNRIGHYISPYSAYFEIIICISHYTKMFSKDKISFNNNYLVSTLNFSYGWFFFFIIYETLKFNSIGTISYHKITKNYPNEYFCFFNIKLSSNWKRKLLILWIK